MIGFALGTITAWAGLGDAASTETGSAPRDSSAPELAPPHDPPANAVVGGQPAPAGAWDDAVALYSVTNQFACSGVLVAPDLVLTAGHCGANLGGAVLGTTNLRRGGVRVEVVETLVHPDWFTTFDAAIVILEREVDEIEPRRIALDCIAEDYVTAGAPVAIVGFGATDAWATEWTTQLHEAFTTVSDPVCADLAAGCYEEVSPGGELIAGGSGIDSCAGDSGGPLYLRTPDQLDWLVGITSRARVPAESACGSGGIYVRVDALVNWIEAETGRVLERPECDGRNRLPSATAEPIDVVHGSSGLSVIEVRDPDVDQNHRFVLRSGPAHGYAQIDPDGAVYYLAPDLHVGDDALVVDVTDDGDPPLTASISIPIRVRPSSGGKLLEPTGCSTAPGGVWPVLLLLACGLVPRRRSA